MKPGCVPHKFICPPDRKIRTSDAAERPYIAKKQKKMILEECEELIEEIEERWIVTGQSSFEEITTGSLGQENVEEVHTMSDSFQCRTCLTLNTKPHVINNTPLQETFEKMTNTKLDDLGRIVVCYICYAELQNTRRFIDMSLKSEMVYTELNNEGVEITQETLRHVKELLERQPTYAVTPTVQFYNGFKYDSEGNVKKDPALKEIEEIEEQKDSTANEIALKAEPVFIENEVVIREELMWLEEDIDVEGEVTPFDTFDADSDGQLEDSDVDIEDISGSDTENLNIT